MSLTNGERTNLRGKRGLICLDFMFSWNVVPSFSETRGEPTTNHASAEEKVQKPNHSGLQDFGRRNNRYGYGKFSLSCNEYEFGLSDE